MKNKILFTVLLAIASIAGNAQKYYTEPKSGYSVPFYMSGFYINHLDRSQLWPEASHFDDYVFRAPDVLYMSDNGEPIKTFYNSSTEYEGDLESQLPLRYLDPVMGLYTAQELITLWESGKYYLSSAQPNYISVKGFDNYIYAVVIEWKPVAKWVIHVEKLRTRADGKLDFHMKPYAYVFYSVR